MSCVTPNPSRVFLAACQKSSHHGSWPLQSTAALSGQRTIRSPAAAQSTVPSISCHCLKTGKCKGIVHQGRRESLGGNKNQGLLPVVLKSLNLPVYLNKLQNDHWSIKFPPSVLFLTIATPLQPLSLLFLSHAVSFIPNILWIFSISLREYRSLSKCLLVSLSSYMSPKTTSQKKVRERGVANLFT